MTQRKPIPTAISFALAGMFFSGGALAAGPYCDAPENWADPEVWMETYSVEAGADFKVHVSIPEGVSPHNATTPPDLCNSDDPKKGDGDPGDEFHVEVFRVGPGQEFVSGLAGFADTPDSGEGDLGEKPVFIGVHETMWPWQGTTVTVKDIQGADNQVNLTSGIYQLKVCLGGRINGKRGTEITGGVEDITCDKDPDHKIVFTSFTVRPKGATTNKILLVDNQLTRVAESGFNGGPITGSGAAQDLAHPMDTVGSRGVQAVAAWLSQKGYGYDAMSSLDIEGGIPDQYKVVIFADHNAVWTDGMRTALTNYVAQQGHNVMMLSGQTMYWKGVVADGKLTVGEKGDTSAIALSFDKGGYVNGNNILLAANDNDNGLYKINNPTHWVYHGLTVADGDTFGGDVATPEKRIVGPVVDGADVTLDGNNIPATTFAVGANQYQVIAWSPALNGGVSGFALPGVFRSGSGGWIFNAATARWSEGLTDFDGQTDEATDVYTAFPLTDSITSAITKNVLDVMLDGGPVDTDGDGIIDKFDDKPNDKDNDGVDDSKDNCPADANADQKDSDDDGVGDVCDTPNGDATDDNTDNGGDSTDDTNNNADNQGGGGGSFNPALLLSLGLFLRRRRKTAA